MPFSDLIENEQQHSDQDAPMDCFDDYDVVEREIVGNSSLCDSIGSNTNTSTNSRISDAPRDLMDGGQSSTYYTSFDRDK